MKITIKKTLMTKNMTSMRKITPNKKKKNNSQKRNLL